MTIPRELWIPANRNPLLNRSEQPSAPVAGSGLGGGGRDNGGDSHSFGPGKATGTLSSQGRKAAIGGLKEAGVKAGVSGISVGAMANHFGASNSVNIGVNAAAKGLLGAVPRVVGDVVNAEMGVDPTAAKIGKYGGYALGAVNPALGYAAQMFGGLAVDGVMDGLGLRGYESFSDQIEASKPRTVKGYFDAKRDIAIGTKNLDADKDGWGDDPDTGYGNVDHFGGGRPTGELANSTGAWGGRDAGPSGSGDGGGDGHGNSSNGGNGGGLGGSNQGGGDHDGGHGSIGGR